MRRWAKLRRFAGPAGEGKTTAAQDYHSTPQPQAATSAWPRGHGAEKVDLAVDRRPGGPPHTGPSPRRTLGLDSDNLRASLEPAKYAATLAGALGLLALALTSVGMSGVFAYMVRQRTREIGLRMALGAQPAQVVRLVLASNLRALAWGLAVGLAGAFGVTRVLKSMMNGISAFDPLAYAGVFALLIAGVVAASALPARRAARVDPVTALRWE